MNSSEILYKDRHLRVNYQKASKILHCQWIGRINGSTVKKLGGKILEIASTHDVTKILNDNTHVTGSWARAAHWAATNWFPAIFATGVVKFGWIMAKDEAAKMSARKAMPDTKHIKIFIEAKSALDWLNEQETDRPILISALEPLIINHSPLVTYAETTAKEVGYVFNFIKGIYHLLYRKTVKLTVGSTSPALSRILRLLVRLQSTRKPAEEDSRYSLYI